MPQTSWRTITARYRGICRRCDGPIAVGDRIRYGGYGRTYHLKAECSAADDQDTPQPTPAADARYYNARRNTAPITPSAVHDQADDSGRDNGAPFVDDRDTGDRTADDTPHYIATPAGPVSDRSWGTATDYGSRSEPPADLDTTPSEPPADLDRWTAQADVHSRTAGAAGYQPLADEPPADDWSF